MWYKRFPKELKQYFNIASETRRKRVGFRELEKALDKSKSNQGKEEDKEEEKLMTEIDDQDSDRDDDRDLFIDIQLPRVVNHSVEPRHRLPLRL